MGAIELRASAPVWIESVAIYPAEPGILRAEVELRNLTGSAVGADLTADVPGAEPHVGTRGGRGDAEGRDAYPGEGREALGRVRAEPVQPRPAAHFAEPERTRSRPRSECGRSGRAARGSRSTGGRSSCAGRSNARSSPTGYPPTDVANGGGSTGSQVARPELHAVPLVVPARGGVRRGRPRGGVDPPARRARRRTSTPAGPQRDAFIEAEVAPDRPAYGNHPSFCHDDPGQRTERRRCLHGQPGGRVQEGRSAAAVHLLGRSPQGERRGRRRITG